MQIFRAFVFMVDSVETDWDIIHRGLVVSSIQISGVADNNVNAIGLARSRRKAVNMYSSKLLAFRSGCSTGASALDGRPRRGAFV